MRVAYVCADPGVPVCGEKGCSIHVQEIVRSMIRLGARVDLFAPHVDGPRPNGLESARFYPLPDARGSHAKARERAALLANGPLRIALESSGPFDLIYERHSLWSVEAMRYARDRGIPGVLEVNAPLVDEQGEHRVLCDRTTALLAARDAFTAAHTIAAVSRGAAEYVERFIGATTKLHVVPNGVDPSRFAESSAPRGCGGDLSFTIGFVGSLKPWHGLPILAEAFATLHAEDSRTRLLIVGDGPERAATERWIGAHGLSEAARFTGAVPPECIPPLLASMDAAVAPYPPQPHFYFSPLKVLEYMAAGLPIVASRIGQLEDLIADGESGFLCTPGDSHALAARLRRLRDDPALSSRLGAAARAVVVERHTWKAVTSRILALTGLGASAEARP
jgi:glycosyltransferase involved in cell wall biosynthesis